MAGNDATPGKAGLVRQAEVALAQGKTVGEVCRAFGIRRPRTSSAVSMAPTSAPGPSPRIPASPWPPCPGIRAWDRRPTSPGANATRVTMCWVLSTRSTPGALLHRGWDGDTGHRYQRFVADARGVTGTGLGPAMAADNRRFLLPTGALRARARHRRRRPCLGRPPGAAGGSATAPDPPCALRLCRPGRPPLRLRLRDGRPGRSSARQRGVPFGRR